MGLSTKQVSGDGGLDWGQQSLLDCGALELPKPHLARRQPPQQQQGETLPCPRCASTNTKFCYYNNYNKSQPRHFCRACKRHWTKGGTLRNVPVGGGRKNKRIKTSHTTVNTTTNNNNSSTSGRINTHMGIQCQQHSQTFPQTIGDRKNIPEILYQALMNHPPQDSASAHSFDNRGDFNVKSFSYNNGNFPGSSTVPLLHNQTTIFNFMSQPAEFPREFPSKCRTIGLEERNPSSNFPCLRSSDAYNFIGGLVSTEDTSTTTMPTSTTDSMASQPWQLLPTTNSSVMMEMPSYWNLDDIDSLVSTELNIPWDDTEVKP